MHSGSRLLGVKCMGLAGCMPSLPAATPACCSAWLVPHDGMHDRCLLSPKLIPIGRVVALLFCMALLISRPLRACSIRYSLWSCQHSCHRLL